MPESSVETTIDELREVLARQILVEAIDSDNPQFKLDAFKATERYGKNAPKAASEAPVGGMATFQARLRHAERGVNGDADNEAAPDR